ncbi:uncharacterized protein BDR25DRAFT_304295 [Lindgomyces ingoldianus]|uniref:Uncharacterized protein n=1 Tax=Lindgomyces ingoldianus TaxID=673940 RepID=A0ACB6QUE5_9PLEO|nr:uncharacterized protein BDR25DRAFT_304295 [Lindgomyces ingoldianus]KAF2469917.1 hypothetical protein BDR25DRAFT_304295 [Lindgomyces ingoldianus]
MASSGSVFSETLQSITTTKLEELAKQRVTFEEQYSALVEVARSKDDPLDRLSFLVDGAKACLGVKTTALKNKDGKRGRVISGGTSNPRLETDLKNLDRFLEQARYDPSVSPKVLEDWEKSILQYLAVQSSKFQYADLYGKLVTEWLSSEKNAPADGDIEMVESFEELPTAKKMEARNEWEKVVFEPAAIDVQRLEQYLQSLFITRKKDVAKAIKSLRDKVDDFESTMASSAQFSVQTLRWVIQGLQSSDLLTNEKREVLKDFLSNEVILGEIADVLNMRMASLARWTWGDHVPLEQRRKLNGSYSVHMHEDLLQAIFLHYIGVKWSVFFKSTFLAFYKDKSAWKPNSATIPKADRKRREYYLGNQAIYPNLQNERQRKHGGTYFMHQLLDHDSQLVVMQQGEEEAEFGDFIVDSEDLSSPPRKRAKQTRAVPQMQMMQNAIMMQQQQQQMQQAISTGHQQQVARQHYQAQPQVQPQQRRQSIAFAAESDGEDNQSGPKKPIEAKQNLLHLLSTEIVINTKLHNELTCFHSVFESWNPLLPHDSILSVLKFFGVSEKWTKFFKTFLQAPLKFTDDESAAPRLRRRGTPGSHALSDVFGEALLFCLEFSVNHSTDGALLYRLYDDFWFWSPDYEKCAKAWSATLQFTKAMGVQLSESKTGTVRVSGDGAYRPIDNRLPKGQIRWGFLYLDPYTGRFEIDQKMVDSHVQELRKQLQGKSKSVIDWIQAWNTYAATFFSSNFGKAANCFGRDHVDRMLATHRHIQEDIFEGGNVVSFLKKQIEERFGVKDIPDGFLFFPVELGGLDLKSPFVGLLQIREGVREDPYGLMDEYEEAERDDYQQAKKTFDKGDIRNLRYNIEDAKWKPTDDADEFFSFEEYIRYREGYRSGYNADLAGVYRELLRRPTEQSIDVSVQVKQAIHQLYGQNNLRGITFSWDSMEAYWKWVAQMYGPEMVEKFGGLNVVDPGLLPIGMVSMFREKRIKWQG